jgi:hypothetical protein
MDLFVIASRLDLRYLSSMYVWAQRFLALSMHRASVEYASPAWYQEKKPYQQSLLPVTSTILWADPSAETGVFMLVMDISCETETLARSPLFTHVETSSYRYLDPWTARGQKHMLTYAWLNAMNSLSPSRVAAQVLIALSPGFPWQWCTSAIVTCPLLQLPGTN